ncbi:MAG: Asp-tRNA(Asn)/Glu-tRNA(Gln) amidotransferase subunit GatA [Xanthomonadales bacterium]|nr:Asp-tRNA(Asn)/Glu-tRNA(Gln) amidotransferase subunit GatA [Xanthomonadales bacterium]
MLPTDLQGQLAGLRAGDFSAPELLQASLQRADDWMDLNAWITRCDPQLLQAAAAEMREGALAGIPYAHKDLYCTAGLRTTCGSRMLEHFVPPYSAAVHERIEAAGGLLLGKANLDEFAMGSSNEHSHFGPVGNPWDPARVPGGSSGASAALVAARVVPFATATDTGGSIRQPAAYCGVTGLKPTYGRVSRWGMVAYASSLDQGGVIAQSAADCAAVLGVMAGFDPRDATSLDAPVEDYSAALNQPLRGLRIGVADCFFGAGVSAAVAERVRAALDQLTAAGAELIEVSLPHAELAIAAYYVIAPAEASSNLARYDGVRYGHRCEAPKDLDDLYRRTRSEGFGAEVQRRILAGSYVLSSGYYDAYYRRAQQVRRLVAQDYAQAFERVDLIAGPTAPTVAFRRGEKLADPVAMYAEDVNTVGVNLAGLPAISVPCGFDQGLPVGLQLIAPALAEARLLAAAHQYQQLSDWHRQAPSRGEVRA